jgi:hypothetical protein
LTVIPVSAGQPPQLSAPAAGQKTCEISTDPEFALTAAKPARVGGGAFYVAARERRYLEALRGPAGQPIAFKRLGQARGPNSGPNSLDILDNWQVTYDGLEKPISIFIDAYHYGEPKAPVGFTCVPFTLGPPPVDAFMASDMLVRLAIEQGTSREFAPIPLGADGSTTHGVAFDRFRLIARAAHAAAAAGKPMDPKEPLREVQNLGMVLIAYPLSCGDRKVPPVGIDVVPKQGAPVQRQGEPVSGADLQKLVPGLTAPDGSIGIRVGVATIRPIDTVRISYSAETCDGSTKEVTLPPAHTAMRGVTMPQPALPAGADPPEEPLWVQVLVDHDGVLQQATYIGGPQRLASAAIEGLREWRAEPGRINGVPVTADSLVIIRFR